MHKKNTLKPKWTVLPPTVSPTNIRWHQNYWKNNHPGVVTEQLATFPLYFIYFSYTHTTVHGCCITVALEMNCYLISFSSDYPAYRSLCFPHFYFVSPDYKIQTRIARTSFDYFFVCIVYLFHLFLTAKAWQPQVPDSGLVDLGWK